MSAVIDVNPVLTVPAAEPASALAHFEALARYETDCWDVHAALQRADPGFVLLDVRAPDLFARGHVAGAVNLPHRRITEASLVAFAAGATFVVYCGGSHCNGADKAAVRLARLGRPVKKMIGGIEGWKDEGFDLRADGDGGNRARET